MGAYVVQLRGCAAAERARWVVIVVLVIGVTPHVCTFQPSSFVSAVPWTAIQQSERSCCLLGFREGTVKGVNHSKGRCLLCSPGCMGRLA